MLRPRILSFGKQSLVSAVGELVQINKISIEELDMILDLLRNK
jgi:hypothetical protein